MAPPGGGAEGGPSAAAAMPAPAPVPFRSLPPLPLTDAFMQAPLPLGPAGVLRHGTLANGLAYYVRPNAKPPGRVALALAVRVGSLMEEEAERGVAHILEHLAFSATESYSNHDLIKFLESIGASFGACTNAYTSTDETVYELLVPVDSPTGEDLLGRALSVLSEFACSVRVSPQDLAKERGAVLEEWRAGRDAQGRMVEDNWRLTFEGSKYAARMPIGTEAVIRGVTAETVKGFYRRWYRPERMAVVVVGDLPDAAAAEALVRAHFAGVPGSDGRPPLPAQLPDPESLLVPQAEPRFSVRADREASSTSVCISFIQPRGGPIASPQHYRVYLARWLFENALAQRFYHLSRRPDPPFYSASAESDVPALAARRFALSATAADGRAAAAAEALLTEVARVRLHGFTPRELAAARARVLADLESLWLERDQAYSYDIRDELVDHHIRGDFACGTELETRLAATLLPGVAAAEVVAAAGHYDVTKSCIVEAVEPRPRVRREELAAVLARVAAAEAAGAIAPWEDSCIPEQLVASPPAAPGRVVARRAFPETQASELTLSNGMRIVLRRTDFLADQILVRGFAPGGLSCELARGGLPRFHAASCGPLLAGELGVFGLRPAILEEALAGKRAAISQEVGAYWRGFHGEQSPVDVEIGLQLIYLLFTTQVAPVAEELASVLALTREQIAAQQRDPTTVYGQRVRALNYGDALYFRPMDVVAFDAAVKDPAVATEFFNAAFRDPSEFCVAIVGSFEEATLVPLLERWLGGIPAPAAPAGPRPLASLAPIDFRFPSRPRVLDVRLPMVEAAGQSQISFPVQLPRGRELEARRWMRIATRVIESKLMRVLRFQYGEVYSVSVADYYGAEAPAPAGVTRGDLTICFACDPQRSTALIRMALDELALLQEVGPEQADVDTAAELERRLFETELHENSFWRDRIVFSYKSPAFRAEWGSDLDAAVRAREATRTKLFAELSAGTLRTFLREALPFPCRKLYTAVSLKPSRPLWRRPALLLGAVAAAGLGLLRALAHGRRRRPSGAGLELSR